MNETELLARAGVSLAARPAASGSKSMPRSCPPPIGIDVLHFNAVTLRRTTSPKPASTTLTRVTPH